MLTIRIASTVFLLSFATAAFALDPGDQLAAAQEMYRAGNLGGALQGLEPLLEADDLDQPFKQRVREWAARVLQTRGEEHFREARIAESIADFDRQIQLQPDRAAAHWQRGIVYYYAASTKRGRNSSNSTRPSTRRMSRMRFGIFCAWRAGRMDP